MCRSPRQARDVIEERTAGRVVPNLMAFAGRDVGDPQRQRIACRESRVGQTGTAFASPAALAALAATATLTTAASTTHALTGGCHGLSYERSLLLAERNSRSPYK